MFGVCSEVFGVCSGQEFSRHFYENPIPIKKYSYIIKCESENDQQSTVILNNSFKNLMTMVYIQDEKSRQAKDYCSSK